MLFILCGGRAIFGVAMNSLSNRLLGGLLLWLIISLGLGIWALSSGFRNAAEKAFDARLTAYLYNLVVSGKDGLENLRPLGDPRFEQPLSGWYWQVSEGTKAIRRSRSLWDAEITLFYHNPDNQIIYRRISGPKGEALRLAERDFFLPGKDDGLHFIIAASIVELEAEIAAFDRLLLFFSGGLAGVFLIGAFIQVGFGLRPLRFLTREIAAVKAGSQEKLNENYPKEINLLAKTLNQLLEEYAALLERARKAAGDLAHGLKTPIAVIGLEVEKPLGADKEICQVQLATMRRFIDHHLAKAATSGSLSRGEIELNALISQIIGVLRQQYAERNLEIILKAPQKVSFLGDREDWEEMLGNLLENAAKWAKSRVEICLNPGEICIDDDGPGIPVGKREEVLNRGQRLDQSTPGSGLGLSIANDIAGVYRLQLGLEGSELGGVRVRLGWR